MATTQQQPTAEEPAQSHRVIANYKATRSRKVKAVCCCCDSESAPVKPNAHGEPDLWNMGRGWSEAPFPHDFMHQDGSVGSMYTCPSCNKRLCAGEALTLRWARTELTA